MWEISQTAPNSELGDTPLTPFGDAGQPGAWRPSPTGGCRLAKEDATHDCHVPYNFL